MATALRFACLLRRWRPRARSARQCRERLGAAERLRRRGDRWRPVPAVAGRIPDSQPARHAAIRGRGGCWSVPAAHAAARWMEAGIVEEPEPLPAGRGYAFDAVLSVPALNPEGARHTPRSRAADRDGASRPSRHELTDGRRGSAGASLHRGFSRPLRDDRSRDRGSDTAPAHGAALCYRVSDGRLGHG